MASDVKQVLVYRRDLAMRKGKIAAQCAHASLAVFLRRRVEATGWVERRDGGEVVVPDADALVCPLDADMAAWVRAGGAKIVLSVASEADLLALHDQARAAGLPCALITDAGHTEFGGVPTRTALAIGPARAEAVDPITRDGPVPTKLA